MGRGFVKANRDKGSLHAWEEDDYDANQRKLQLFAEKQLAGRNNRQLLNNPEGNNAKEKKVKEHPAIAKTSPKRAEKSSSRSRSKSLEKLRKKASSSMTIYLLY